MINESVSFTIVHETCDECSDFNEDGSSNILDIIQLVNIILGD